MNEEKNSGAVAGRSTRRQAIAGAAVVLGGLLAGSKPWGQAPPQQGMRELPSAAAHAKVTSIHMEAEFKVSPARVYEALLDSKQFAAFSGLPAEIDRTEGGAFSMFQRQIVGRNVELVSRERIVQAWRPAHWDAGVYSIVEFRMKLQSGPAADGVSINHCTLVLDHRGFPEGEFDSLLAGWKSHYFEGLDRFLAA